MRVMPCRKCGRGATLPDGKLYLIQSWPGPQPYKCANCSTKTSVSAVEFNRLPEIAEEPPVMGIFKFRKRESEEPLSAYHALRDEAYKNWSAGD